MLAMQHADMLTAQGAERERVQLLEATLHSHEPTDDGDAKMERLVLEFMFLDASYWAYGKMEGLLDKARQVRGRVCQVDIDKLSDLEVSFIYYHSSKDALTRYLKQLRAITLYYQVVNSCETVSNFVKPQDGTIFLESGRDRASEVRQLRKSLVTRGKYNRASAFMQLELTLVQGLEMQTSVGASFGFCSVMEQTQNKLLLFRSAKLKRQLSGILLNIIRELGEQSSRQSTELFGQIFPRMEDQCPAVSFDLAVDLVRDSSSTEGEKSRNYVDLSNAASERKDFTRANQALIAAQDAAQKNWHQCKTLSSGCAALQHLHDLHTAYIDLHQKDAGMAFFESAGVNDYLTTLSVHYKDNHRLLRTFEDFQGRHIEFGIPTHQERMFDIAVGAAKKLAMKEQLQRYSMQHFKWFKQSPISDQWGRLTESALSDPDQYLRQMFVGAEDPIEWGNNALQLILAWAKTEWNKELLTTGTLRELFGFAHKDERDDGPDSFLRFIEALDFEEAAESLYGDLDKPTPSVIFLDIMRRLKDWLCLPDRPPSQAARLNTAKIIMLSRLHRLRLARKSVPEDVDTSEYSEEQKMLDDIEELEDAVGGGWGDQSDRQTASRIFTTLHKCYVSEAVIKGLISDEELQSRISDCVDLVSKYANGGRRFLEYHSLLQQSHLNWQRYLHFKSVPPDSGLEVLEKAEVLFTGTRNQILIPDPADLFTATLNLTEEFMSQEHCKMAVTAAFTSFLENMAAAQRAQSQGVPNPKLGDLACYTYERFLKWTHRSKGRGLIDLLYLDVELVQHLVEKSSNKRGKPIAPGIESNLSSSVENLHIGENITLQDEAEQAEPLTNGVTPLELSNDVTDEMITSKAMINEMLRKVGDDVVLVDIINIAYLGQGGSQAILYRKDTHNLPIPLPDITLQAIERWVEKNLGTQERSINEPLRGEGNASGLEELTPLLMPLFKRDLPQSIKPKEVIIFCLTGALHRIPIHAVPINGVPLIESHPVAYCQSLTTLHRGYEAVGKFQHSSPGVESLAIVPSYKQSWIDDAEAEAKLLQKIEGVCTDLNAKVCSGSYLTKEIVQDSLSDCAHTHYFGHVHYNSKLPIRSALLLNESARVDQSLEDSGSEGLAVRDLFKSQLHKPALATIIGCGSGQTLISNSDDVLGLPSAFLFAGASAIVSTLWPISADEGADFAVEFYRAFHQQQVSRKTEERNANQESGLKRCVNLAYVMQEAVNKMRQRGENKKAAYYWAAFYLTGFWLFPPLAMK